MSWTYFYFKILVVYLKFKFNWASNILSSSPKREKGWWWIVSLGAQKSGGWACQSRRWGSARSFISSWPWFGSLERYWWEGKCSCHYTGGLAHTHTHTYTNSLTHTYPYTYPGSSAWDANASVASSMTGRVSALYCACGKQSQVRGLWRTQAALCSPSSKILC